MTDQAQEVDEPSRGGESRWCVFRAWPRLGTGSTGKRIQRARRRWEIESSAKPKPLRKRHGPRLLEWERQAILDAYREGEKVAALCAEFGVARNYPRSLARRRGFPVRIQGRPTNKKGSIRVYSRLETPTKNCSQAATAFAYCSADSTERQNTKRASI